jgi:hypothetical protein
MLSYWQIELAEERVLLSGNFSSWYFGDSALRTRCILTLNLLSICFCVSVISASILLRPNPEGYGTHKSLGLPSCLTAKVLGLKRCPSCGLTTAFALIGKGDFQTPTHVHPWVGPFYGLVFVFLATSIFSLIKKELKIWVFPV